MVAYGHQKLNKNDVRRATWRFIMSFAVLVGMSFLTVFLFFKSSQKQQVQTQKEADNYKQLMSRNQLMKEKLDAVKENMSLMNNGKVNNEIFLMKKIQEDIDMTKAVMGPDSASALKHYAVFTKHLDKMMRFKNELLNISIKEQNAQKELMDCMGSNQRYTDDLINNVPKVTKKFKGR